MSSWTPDSTADVLLHQKDTDRTETVIYPFTRYKNVFASPTVVEDPDTNYGAPFHLLRTGTEKVTVNWIKKYCGNIV